MSGKGTENPSLVHVAGIIPAAGLNPNDFDFPWHFSMMPIGPDILAIERSVAECSYAGCSTIWIICNDDMQMLLRKRVGDWVYDARYSHLEKIRQVKDPEEFKKRAAIYYIPIHSYDRKRKDSYGWSVLAGAKQISSVCGRFSSRLVPSRFYVSFPTGVYPHWVLRNHRKVVKRKPFYISHDGKTVADGLPLGFTFQYEQLTHWRENVRKKGTLKYKLNEEKEIKKLPIPERYSAKGWDISQVFEHDLSEDAFLMPVEDFHDITTWDGYGAAVNSPVGYGWNHQTFGGRYDEFGPIAVEEKTEDGDRPVFVLEGWLKEKMKSPNRE